VHCSLIQFKGMGREMEIERNCWQERDKGGNERSIERENRSA